MSAPRPSPSPGGRGISHFLAISRILDLASRISSSLAFSYLAILDRGRGRGNSNFEFRISNSNGPRPLPPCSLLLVPCSGSDGRPAGDVNLCGRGTFSYRRPIGGGCAWESLIDQKDGDGRHHVRRCGLACERAGGVARTRVPGEHVRQLRAREQGSRGRERIRWRNTSSVPVEELQFHLYLNAFANDRSTFMTESGGQLRGVEIPKDGWGWIEVESMRWPTARISAAALTRGEENPDPFHARSHPPRRAGAARSGRPADLKQVEEFISPDDGNGRPDGGPLSAAEADPAR